MFNRKKIPTNKSKLKPKQADRPKKSKPKFIHHPLYGNIPLIEGQWGSYPDPNFKPKIPVGAAPGNVALQEFCSHCHLPQYFYVDKQSVCVQCGKDFIFQAKEQKFWYENLKFNFHSHAIRCLDCRKKKRNEKSIKIQNDKAYEICKKNPKDPYALIALSEAVCLYFETFQKGHLEEAIASARKAYKLDKNCQEALYWEALAQKFAGREKKSQQLFKEFLERATSIPRCKNLCKKAHAYVKV